MTTNKSSLSGTVMKTAVAAVIALGLAGAANVERAQAKDWVGPAIAGAIVGGIIAHQVYKHHGYKYSYKRHYGAPSPYRKKVKHRHYRHYPPAYYRPAVVVPLPFFAIRPGW